MFLKEKERGERERRKRENSYSRSGSPVVSISYYRADGIS